MLEQPTQPSTNLQQPRQDLQSTTGGSSISATPTTGQSDGSFDQTNLASPELRVGQSTTTVTNTTAAKPTATSEATPIWPALMIVAGVVIVFVGIKRTIRSLNQIPAKSSDEKPQKSKNADVATGDTAEQSVAVDAAPTKTKNDKPKPSAKAKAKKRAKSRR